MAGIYPKYRHIRPLDAPDPDWQGAAALPRPARDAQAGGKRAWQPGTLLKAALLALLAWGSLYALQHRRDTGPGVSVPAAAMGAMSALDASLLGSLPRRLEDACERNMYTPARRECLTRLHARGALCQARVAPRYPEHSARKGRLPAIIDDYLHCVFEG